MQRAQEQSAAQGGKALAGTTQCPHAGRAVLYSSWSRHGEALPSFEQRQQCQGRPLSQWLCGRQQPKAVSKSCVPCRLLSSKLNRVFSHAPGDGEALVASLVQLGFAEDDAGSAADALGAAAGLAAALDWLCLHIPENLLPASFAPGELSAGPALGASCCLPPLLFWQMQGQHHGTSAESSLICPCRALCIAHAGRPCPVLPWTPAPPSKPHAVCLTILLLSAREAAIREAATSLQWCWRACCLLLDRPEYWSPITTLPMSFSSGPQDKLIIGLRIQQAGISACNLLHAARLTCPPALCTARQAGD